MNRDSEETCQENVAGTMSHETKGSTLHCDQLSKKEKLMKSSSKLHSGMGASVLTVKEASGRHLAHGYASTRTNQPALPCDSSKLGRQLLRQVIYL